MHCSDILTYSLGTRQGNVYSMKANFIEIYKEISYYRAVVKIRELLERIIDYRELMRIISTHEERFYCPELKKCECNYVYRKATEKHNIHKVMIVNIEQL